MHFLVDEDLPRSLVRALRLRGIGADHLLDLAPRGRPDDEVIALALSRGFALLSSDLGFGNLLRYPLGTHRGIVIVRFPNVTSNETLCAGVLASLQNLTQEDLDGTLVIIEPGRVRLRRKQR